MESQRNLDELNRHWLELTAVLPIDHRSRSFRGPLKEGSWTQVGVTEVDKIKAFHTFGLFAKVFSPRMSEYAARYNTAYGTLLRCNLTVPLLPKLFATEYGVLFPLGVAEEEIRWLDLPDLDREVMTKVAEDFGLTPLTRSYKLPIIAYDDQKYNADPFEDSQDSITSFLEQNNLR